MAKKIEQLGFSLSDAKKMAKKESEAQPRKLIYVKVEADGSFEISGFANKDNAVHCYRGGSEIPMTFKANKSSADVDSQTSNMATTKKGAEVKKSSTPAKKGEKSKATALPGNSGPPMLQGLTESQYQKLCKLDGKIKANVAKALVSFYKL